MHKTFSNHVSPEIVEQSAHGHCVAVAPEQEIESAPRFSANPERRKPALLRARQRRSEANIIKVR